MRSGRGLLVLMALAALLALALPAAAAQTTTIEVVRYGWDNATVAQSVTVNVSWMEAHLPVMGDGVTPYRFQGPTFVETDLWNPAETMNLEKINETVKGTAIHDLVELVGGMYPGDEVQVRAADGFRKRLNFTNVYAPPARQGPPILAWWNSRNGYAWPESMRLFFLADISSNSKGWHVFGNEDMRQCLSSAYWHYFYADGVNFPSAAGLSVATIARLEIFPAPRAIGLPGSGDVPRDLDLNGKYEDVNGNGRKDFGDVVIYFNQMGWIGANEPVAFFDYNGNGRIDFADTVALFVAL
ncbi:MAG: dockerin type I domain-containing protein [Methanospirillum sp.]